MKLRFAVLLLVGSLLLWGAFMMVSGPEDSGLYINEYGGVGDEYYGPPSPSGASPSSSQ